MDGVAADCAVEVNASKPNGKLTREYIHQGADISVKGSDTLNYIWEIEANSYIDTYECASRCDNVIQRGVPFPDRWKTALTCLTLSETVRESVAKVTELGEMRATWSS